MATIRGLDVGPAGPLDALHRAGHEFRRVPRDRTTPLAEAPGWTCAPPSRPGDTRFNTLDNVVMTPHTGAGTPTARTTTKATVTSPPRT